MATKRRAVDPGSVQIGDHLRSKKVGSKDWFVGEVVELKPGAVVQRDTQRRRWLREWHELEMPE